MVIQLSRKKRRRIQPRHFRFLLAFLAVLVGILQSRLHSKAASSSLSLLGQEAPHADLPRLNNNKQTALPTPTKATTRAGVSLQRQQQQRKGQPKVILHIGPHKTGTTTIQSFIKRNQTIQLLLEDDIVMPTHKDLRGKNLDFPEFNWAQCITGVTKRSDSCRKKIFPKFAVYLNETFHKRQSIFMVVEDLDNLRIVNMTLLKQSLFPYTDIRVIVTYRRLHDWVKSWYNEIMRLYNWKILNNKRFTSYTDWLQKDDQDGGGYDKFYNRHAMSLETAYQQNNMTVHVLHFHRNQTSLLENLFCHVYTKAPNTCQAIQQQFVNVTRKPQRVSKDDELEVCRIVYYSKNFQLSKHMRKFSDIGDYYLPLLERRNISIRKDFPVIRPAQTLIDKVWNQTVLAETKYYSKLFDHDDEESSRRPEQPTPEFWRNLRQEFDQAIEAKWYSTDVEEMLRTNLFDRLLADSDEGLQHARPNMNVKRDNDAVDKRTTTSVWNCLEVKDAEQYMDEWADYHFAAGFTFLRIFDNSENFNLRNWAGKDNQYKDKVKISHHANIEGKVGTQAKAYKECLQEAVAEKVDWVATIDIDEFLVLKKHDSVVDLLNDHCSKENKCGQLSFNWRMFGSANQTKYHPIPVTRRFQYKMDTWQGTIKVIADPNAVDLEHFHWQHSMRLKPGYTWLDTDGTIVQNTGWRVMTNDNNPSDVAVLHHYRYKSQEEWDFTNCVRGCQYNSKCKQRCNTTAKAGHILDDSAWQQLRRMVPSYQEFDDVGELE